jgi:anti-anti-sigma regulatory factor
MTDMTLNVAVKGSTTVMTAQGSIDASRCRLLRDVFRMAQQLRGRGPIVVDFARVDRVAAVGVLVLREVADVACRNGRPVTMRHLFPGIIDDPRSLLLRHTVCDQDESTTHQQRDWAVQIPPHPGIEVI